MMRFHSRPADWALALLVLVACAPAIFAAAQPPVITSATSDSAVAGTPYSYTIAAINNPTSFNADGLPTGLTVNTGTGVISGTTNEVGTFIITMSATNGAGTGTATLSLKVNPLAPIISSPLSVNGSLGVPFSYTIASSGIPEPGFAASPMPPGLLLGGDTISGKPLQSGTTFVTLTATNVAGKDTKLLTINITAPPVIASPLIIAGTVGQPLSYTITATNNPTAFGAEPPGAPVGLTFAPAAPFNVNATTGQVSGIPTAAGTFTAVLRATNIVNSSPDPYVFNNTVGKGTATVTFAISAVAGAPAITSERTATAIETEAFVYGITATNAPTSYAIDTATPLPVGLVLDTATGVISGAPDLLPGAPPIWPTAFPVTIIATNSNGSGRATLAITVKPAIPELTSAGLVPAVNAGTPRQLVLTGTMFQYQATATRFTDPRIATSTFATTPSPILLSGNLSMAPLTGLLSGTPADTDGPADYDVRITVTNNRGSGSMFLPLHVAVVADPTITPVVIREPLQAVAIVGAPFSYTINAPGAIYLTAAPIPLHLVFNSVTAIISGTPQPAEAGTHIIGIIAADDNSVDQRNLTLTILPAPVTPVPPVIIFDAASPQAVGTFVGVNFGYEVKTTPDRNDPTQNQLPLLFSAKSLPVGLALNPDLIAVLNQPAARITGIPTQVGTSNATVSVTNATGSDTRNIAFTVAPVTIVSPLTATGEVGKNFLPATDSLGNPVPYVIRASGNPNIFGATGLPPGLSVNVRTGIISGIPADIPGVFPATITAANGYGSAAATLLIVINPKPDGSPEINSALTLTAVDGLPLQLYQITATNSPTVFGAVGLPAGFTADPGTGIIAGVTNQVGSFDVIITAGKVITLGPPVVMGVDAEILKLTVKQAPPVITSSLNVTAPLGRPFRYVIETGGSQPQTYQAVPLPPGLFLNANIITGTPTVPGTNPATVLTVSNQAATVTAELYITVTQVPVFNPPLTVPTTHGDPTFAFTVSANGYPPPDLSVDPNDLTGTGLTFAPQAASGLTGSGVLSGAPAVPGRMAISVTASNAAGTTTAVVTITVNPVAITSPLTLAGVVSTPLDTYTITATGNANIFTATGLPGGLVLNPATGTISGTPYAAGTTEATITASNGVGQASATLVIGISSESGVPAILSRLLLVGVKGTPANYLIVASNSPTSYGATGLPAGLVLNTAIGLISGTPAAGGSTEVTISATNALGTGSAKLVVAIAKVPGGAAITSPLSATVQIGTGFTYQITSINGPLLAYGASLVGAPGLPAGLSFDATTGVISGTPTAAGTYNIVVSATNAVDTADATLVLSVVTTPPPGTVPPPNTVVTTPDDADGDGFPNELEIALGTDPNNPASTPFGGLPAGALQVIDISTLIIKLDFNAGRDSISIRGTLPVKPGFSVASKQVTLVVGGVVGRFALDARGNSPPPRGAATFNLRVSPRLPLQARFASRMLGTFADTLKDEELINDPKLFQVSRTVRTFILVDQTVYDSSKLLTYTVRSGKGYAKQAH